MELTDKIANALIQCFDAEYVRLDDDDRITGFVVSPQFRGVPALDRQLKIDQALSESSLSRDERRRVLMIAALTPEEYAAAGTRVRVRNVKQMAGGAVEIVLDGGPSDAQYIRGALDRQKGIRTTNPRPVAGAVGTMMSLRAKGTESAPITRERIIRALKKDRYVELVGNA